MNDQTQHILGAADSAHQGIELARSLSQESLGNMGEILTQGCMELGPASLGSAMRLGQQLKELIFLLDGLLSNAHGLCVLLGHDLRICEVGGALDDEEPEDPEGHRGFFHCMDTLDSGDLGPREDEFDDDEQPF